MLVSIDNTIKQDRQNQDSDASIVRFVKTAARLTRWSCSAGSIADADHLLGPAPMLLSPQQPNAWLDWRRARPPPRAHCRERSQIEWMMVWIERTQVRSSRRGAQSQVDAPQVRPRAKCASGVPRSLRLQSLDGAAPLPKCRPRTTGSGLGPTCATRQLSASRPTLRAARVRWVRVLLLRDLLCA
eukprot:3380016-Prymnesium_polylepis.2